MELLKARKSASDSHKNAAVLLLTDGMPNIVPPRGHIPMLQKYQKDMGGELPGIINTFGFGYSLDSKLLNDVSAIGSGTYSFIPDGSMVGTIFVNSMSNLLSNVAVNVEIELDLDNNSKLEKSDLLKYFRTQSSGQKLELNLGSVIFGQKKSIVLPISFPNFNNKILQGTLKYKSPFQDSVVSPFNCKITNNNDPQALISRFRVDTGNILLDTVDFLHTNSEKDRHKSDATILEHLSQQMKTLENLIKTMETSAVKDDPYVKDLLLDLKEQVLIALGKKEFYYRWGQHYLPSLAQAHLLQQCNNFKDPGVQHFGGEIFTSIRDKLDDIFLTLAPPTPSIRRGSNTTTVMNMQAFYNPSGVCFDGDCSVLMMDGSYKLIKEIKKGDMVYSTKGTAARVKCVVKTLINAKKRRLVCLEGGLRITPWHPVKINNVFEFPINLGRVMIMECEAVYNFVLEDKHIMNINGIECVTLGHGFEDNQVVKHEYFGTEMMIKDLAKIHGWENGSVEVISNWISRDDETGIINSISTT